MLFVGGGWCVRRFAPDRSAHLQKAMRIIRKRVQRATMQPGESLLPLKLSISSINCRVVKAKGIASCHEKQLWAAVNITHVKSCAAVRALLAPIPRRALR